MSNRYHFLAAAQGDPPGRPYQTAAGGIERSCLAPVEDQVRFGQVPGAAELGEGVQVAKGGDHDLADSSSFAKRWWAMV